MLSSQGDQPFASYDEPSTRTDNRINDRHSDQVKENNNLASYNESQTRTDNKINDPQILLSQGEL